MSLYVGHVAVHRQKRFLDVLSPVSASAQMPDIERIASGDESVPDAKAIAIGLILLL